MATRSWSSTTRTGQVLDAIKAAGVEDNTIVLWLSDNGAAPTQGPGTDWRDESINPAPSHVIYPPLT